MSEIPIYQPQDHEIGIIILYIIDKFNSIREKRLDKYIRDLELLPYFDYKIQLRNLAAGKHVLEKDLCYDNLLALSEKGADALFNLKDAPARSVLDKINESVPKYIELFKAEDEVIAEVIPPSAENGYSYKAHLAINNNARPFVTMEFELPNYAYAERFCDKWKKRAGEIFKELTITLNGGENS